MAGSAEARRWSSAVLAGSEERWASDTLEIGCPSSPEFRYEGGTAILYNLHLRCRGSAAQVLVVEFSLFPEEKLRGLSAVAPPYPSKIASNAYFYSSAVPSLKQKLRRDRDRG